MTQRLIILRGNSGSGKSTIAKELQLKLGHGTMLIPQDVIRREILRVEDKTDNPSGELISMIATYGNKIGYDVIIEGIFSNEKYRAMLLDLIEKFSGRSYVYYFDISFSETVKRHQNKANSNEFGEKAMREWWKEKDYLGTQNEIIITDDMSKDQILKNILADIVDNQSS
ncbi:kinase [Microbacteriaceae bacterium]|nr:kinase [Candidatus Saccharibacteria bacterium]